MKEIAFAVTTLLAFLIPLGIYCMMLGMINRRNKPLVVRGVWDTIGLLAGLSGFLLWTMPALIEEFSRQAFDALQGPYVYSALWIGYYVSLLFFSGMVLFLRAGKTMIYNVDTKLFSAILEQAAAKIGMSMKSNLGRLMFVPAKHEAEANTAFAEKPVGRSPASDDQRVAELAVENFASMCHVTLHWENCEPYLRRQIEDELERGLELAAPEENPAAGWFYTISGLIFGALFMVVAMVFTLIFFPKH